MRDGGATGEKLWRHLEGTMALAILGCTGNTDLNDMQNEAKIENMTLRIQQGRDNWESTGGRTNLKKQRIQLNALDRIWRLGDTSIQVRRIRRIRRKIRKTKRRGDNNNTLILK